MKSRVLLYIGLAILVGIVLVVTFSVGLVVGRSFIPNNPPLAETLSLLVPEITPNSATPSTDSTTPAESVEGVALLGVISGTNKDSVSASGGLLGINERPTTRPTEKVTTSTIPTRMARPIYSKTLDFMVSPDP